MAPKPPTDPDQRAAAEAWFGKRLALTPKEYAALGADAREHGFTVGGSLQLRVVQRVLDSIRDAAKSGEEPDFEAFKEDLREKLKGGAYVDKNEARLKTSFQTTVQTSYNAGRWKVLTSDESMARRPYFMLTGPLDKKTTPLCKRLTGTVRAGGSPFWKRYWPPLHFNCRRSVRALTVRQARVRGVDTAPVAEEPDEGFGRSPENPQAWAPDETEFDDAAFAEFKRKVKRMRSRAVAPKRRK